MVLLLLACNEDPTSTVSVPEGCEGWTGAASADQVLATPRHDPEAEKLAVCMSGEVVAPEAVYRRVQADIATIHEMDPGTTGMIPRLDGDGDLIELEVAEAGDREAAEAASGDWACPTGHYGAVVSGAGDRAVSVRLDGVFDLAFVLADWLAIEGVESALPGGGLPDGPRVVGGIDDDVYHYVFDDRQACDADGCARGFATHWTSTPDGRVRQVDAAEWGGDAPLPDWYEAYGACQN